MTYVNKLTSYIHLLPISKMPNLDTLTDSQRDQLTAQFAEIVADNMDTKDLVRYAIDGMIEYFNEGSLDELREEVNTFDENLFDELVDNVTNETVLDINNTGGKF